MPPRYRGLDVARYAPSSRGIADRAMNLLEAKLREQDKDVDELAATLFKTGARVSKAATLPLSEQDLEADLLPLDADRGAPRASLPVSTTAELPLDPSLVQEPPGAAPAGRTASTEGGGRSFDWNRFVAGVADAMSGGKTDFLGAINTRERGERLARHRDRLYGLKVVETFSKLSVDEANAFKSTLESAGKFRKMATITTEDEAVDAERTIGERFRAIGVPVPQGFVRAMVRVPRVAEMAGVFAPFIEDPAVAGRLAVIGDTMYREGKASEIPKLLEEQGTPFVRHEAGQVFANMARELKNLPEYRDKELPFETVVSAMRAMPGKGQGYALALQNQLGRRESYADWLDTVDFRGVERPDVTAAARKAGAVTAEQERAKGPALSQPVKDYLQGEFGVDSRKLDPTRDADRALIRKARTAVGEEAIESEVKKQDRLLPGRVREQEALLPGRVAVARQTGAAAAEVAENVRRGRKVPADAGALIGLPKGSTIGAAEDRGIKVPEGAELSRLKEFKVFTEQGQEVIRELDTLIAKTPEAIGQSGRAATLAGGLLAQGQNFARIVGMRVDASLDPKDYRDTFRGLGITDARIQSNVIALAFPLAVASQGGSGGRLSDKDVEFQIKRIGANVQDPVAFRAVLADVEGALTRSLDRQIETATGAPRPSGAVRVGPAAQKAARGLTPEAIEGMSLRELGTLDLKRLDAAQRQALDRALKRLGF